MISAREAYKQMMLNRDKKSDEQIKQIDQHIQKSIKKGEKYITLDGELYEKAKQILLDNGYVLDDMSGCDRPYLRIRWPKSDWGEPK